ncbi:hypothetical protein QW060_19365 [Myroides ceti]|uniref:Uncharacterized protein n=1 Tax=Paenimyroides ceti TaxID=395087 RepID=A0ABT8D1U0_9FLAO|nr:hypothetical protein [Paenimyroides ceti]MDN3709194.1 hypothetical protein [Paenimyroides ceti]
MFSPADLGGVFKFTNKSVEDPFRQPAEAFVGVVNRYGMYMVMLPNDVTSEQIVNWCANEPITYTAVPIKKRYFKKKYRNIIPFAVFLRYWDLFPIP